MGVGFVAWFALARPLSIISSLSAREAFKAAYFYGFIFNLFSLWWIAKVTPPGMIATVVIVAGYYALMLLLFNRLYHIKRIFGFVGLPFLWVGLEYFRTLSEFAFPWSDLGYTQSYYLYVIQIVSVIATHGLSLIIAAVNVLVWQLLRRELSVERRLTALFLAMGIVSLLIAIGWAVVPAYPVTGQYKVALLQGSMPIERKWQDENEAESFMLYDSLARLVSHENPKLYVWPETAAPCYLSHDRKCREEIGATANATGAPHLVGALGASWYNGEQRYFNSCFQIDTNGTIDERYDKIKLVPFTEQVPYQDNFPFLRRDVLTKYLTFIKTYDIQWWSDFYPGDSVRLFDSGDTEYGVLICFESTFPELVREMITKGARFIVGITNDTWFEGTPGLHMHARILLCRAVENRIWMVRAANSGHSYFVDGYGRIQADLPLDAVSSLSHDIRLLDEKSTFSRAGDFVGLFSFLFTLVVVLILVVRWIANHLLA